MTVIGLAGTDGLSLSAACCALEKQCRSCTKNADALWHCHGGAERQEARQGEKKTEAELAWIVSYSIAAQHAYEQNEQAE